MTSGVPRYGMIWKLIPAERLEQLGRKVLRAADIDGADIELARLRARRLDEVLQRLELGLRVGGEDEIERADGRDRGELLHRIERQRLVDGGADRGAVGDEAERVAVGRLRQHRARRRDAARPRLIFHHEALPELVAELLRRQPRGDVGDARGAERQDEPNRTAGIVLLGARDRRTYPGHCRRAGEPRRNLPSRDAVLIMSAFPRVPAPPKRRAGSRFLLADEARLGAACNSSDARPRRGMGTKRHTFSSITLARTSSSISRQMWST